MKNETLQRYALIAEIVGGIAVILTLLILVFEIRGNTQAVKTATYDALAADLADWRLSLVTDDELFNIRFITRTEGIDALDPYQTLRLNEYNLVLFQHYERAFIQWQAGNLDDAAWERFRRFLCIPTGSPVLSEALGQAIDTLTTSAFTNYRKNQCAN